MKFPAVAFDLDGTLYPNYRLNIRLVPFLLKDQRLLRAMDKARKKIRNSYSDAQDLSLAGEDFYDTQARLMSGILGGSAEAIKAETEKLIYRGWEPHFKKIRLFPHARETLDAFRKAGIRMGLLSDFPPGIKLGHLKISDYWDAVLCSEECGRLKPDPLSFLELAARLQKPPAEIIYVGNSVPYDVEGARRAGMKTALVCTGLKRRFSVSSPDFIFSDYRQLRDYVLS